MRIKVVNEQGGPLTLGQSFTRQLPWLADSVAFDALFAVVTRDHQRSVELLSKTRVISQLTRA